MRKLAVICATSTFVICCCARTTLDNLPLDAAAESALDAAPAHCSAEAAFTSVLPLSDSINGPYNETGFRLSPDELTAYFSSNRSYDPGQTVFVAHRTSLGSPFGPAGAAEGLDGPIAISDLAPFPSDDQLRLLLSICHVQEPEEQPDLCGTTRGSGTSAFGSPQPIGFTGDSPMTFAGANYLVNSGLTSTALASREGDSTSLRLHAVLGE